MKKIRLLFYWVNYRISWFTHPHDRNIEQRKDAYFLYMNEKKQNLWNQKENQDVDQSQTKRFR